MKVQLPIDAATTSLKDTPLVVSEENDVSRQVVKPIYLEDLDNDGLLTFNQRTSESCGAVQARHTVSAVEDNILNISESISSSPSEILPSNTNNNLVPTHPDNEPSPIQQHSSTYLTEQEIYNEYELLSDSSDNNYNTSTIHTDTIERTNINFYPNPLEIYDPLICYNKFLYYHRLQFLPSPQTVSSFLTYLQEEYPMFYTQQNIRISIKYSRIDYVFEEAHIYLLQEFLLSNHFFILFEDFHLFYKALFKSDNSTLNIPINNIENALFINNATPSISTIIPQPTHSPHTTLQSNNSSLALDLTTTTCSSFKLQSNKL